MPFLPKTNPRRASRNIAPGVWRHPITFGSLVVRSTALTQGGGWVGGVHFKKVPLLIIYDITSQSHIQQMTTFLQCFWISFQIGFASKWNLVSSFGKVSQPICTVFLWASLRCFSKSEIYGTWFAEFSYFRPLFCQMNMFLGLVTCGHVQEFTEIFWKLKMLNELSLIPDQSWSYTPCRQYGSSPVS